MPVARGRFPQPPVVQRRERIASSPIHSISMANGWSSMAVPDGLRLTGVREDNRARSAHARPMGRWPKYNHSTPPDTMSRMVLHLSNENLSVFDRALARSTVLAIIPLSLMWFLDRRERESPLLFASAFLWGGLIATGLAVPFNTAFIHFTDVWVREHPQIKQILGPDAALLLAAPISAPIVEEIAKALGVVLIFWLLRAEFDNMRDGIVYGGLVGLGFNWFEAALYVAQGYAENGTPPYGAELGARYALFGLGGHALFTGMFGAFLGLAMQTRRIWLRYLAPLIGLLLAIGAHMLNNALPLFL